MIRIIPVLLLAGCAATPDYIAPANLTEIKKDVESRYVYQYRYTGIQKEYFRKEDGTANCTKFALEYQKLAGGTITRCQLPSGAYHHVLDVDGWRLDNRYSYVMRVEDSECK